MTGGMESGFSAREIRYLESLPAVARVGRDRIRYAEGFKRECVRRYAAGESPVAIFRSAGLDPSLIGYKRIERCFARWKRTVRFDDPADDMMDGDAGPYQVDEDDRWPARHARPIATGNHRKTTAKDETNPDRPDGSDVYGLIIMQQARRIDVLEHEIGRLRSMLEDGRNGARRELSQTVA